MSRISNEAGLLQAIEQAGTLERGLSALRRDLPQASPANLALLSEGPLDQLDQIQGEIQEYRAQTRASDFLGVRLAGELIHLRETPISVLTAVLDAIRKGVQAIAEIKVRGQRLGRPTAELKRLCDFQILALAPGSLRILMKLPDGDGELPSPASAALDDYLDVAAWAASEDPVDAVEATFGDEPLRKALFAEVQRVVPRPRGILESLEFYGPRVKAVGGRILLERGTRKRLEMAIDRLVKEVPQTHAGILREIDLDARTFTLRTPGTLEQKPCSFGEELIEIAKEALDKPVNVAGLLKIDPQRRGQAVLVVTRLEIVEDGTPAV